MRRAALVRRIRLIRPEVPTRSGRVARRRASVFWSRRFSYWATRPLEFLAFSKGQRPLVVLVEQPVKPCLALDVESLQLD